LVLAIQLDAEMEDPGLVDLHPIGLLSHVRHTTDRGERGIYLVVEVVKRVRLRSLTQSSPFWMVKVDDVEEVHSETPEARALAESLRAHVQELAPAEQALSELLKAPSNPGLVADRIASFLNVNFEKRARVLLELDAEARLRWVAELLNEAKAEAELRQRVDSEVRRELNRNQKEVLLRQQLRAIQKELGEEDDQDDLAPLRAKLDAAALPEEARKVAEKELRRLEKMGPQQAESHVIRTYLDWLAELPWNKRAPATLDVEAVGRVLEED